jgi:hypothetical protein
VISCFFINILLFLSNLAMEKQEIAGWLAGVVQILRDKPASPKRFKPL